MKTQLTFSQAVEGYILAASSRHLSLNNLHKSLNNIRKFQILRTRIPNDLNLP